MLRRLSSFVRSSSRNGRLLGLVACMLLSYPLSSTAQSLMVFPTQVGGGQPLREACLNPQLWPTGWSRMEFFGNSVQYFQQWGNSTEIAQCFTNLRNAGKKLVIEVGALKPDCQTAQACLNVNLPTLYWIASLAPPEVILAIDEPISTGHPNWPNQKADFNYAVQQTVEYIRLVRGLAPGLRFIVHEAYPNNSAATLGSFFVAVNSGAVAQTGMGIQYASIDHDWNAGGTSSDLLYIQNTVRANGVGFSAVFWGAGPIGDSQWYSGLLNQGQMYQNWRSLGLNPDLYSILDWTPYPTTTLNETTWLSFTRSVRDFALRFLPVPSMAAGTALLPGQSRSSADGRFSLTYQADGNLVLYLFGTPVWSSNTFGSPGQAAMQTDGNFVINNSSFTPIWHTNTSGHPGAFLAVQSDGNVVIYTSGINTALWASNTPNW